MDKKFSSNRETAVFLAVSFGLSWLIWLGTAAVFGAGSRQHMLSQVLGQFAPLAAACAAAGRKNEIHWLFRPSGRLPALVCAFLLPGVLTLLGNALYFLLFPENFDPDLLLLRTLLAGSGVTPGKYLLMASVQAVTLGAAVNGLFFLGEEAGFRGFLFPRLKAHFGKSGVVIGGCLWGIWLAPLICLGQHYGSDYPGFPVAGIAAACLYGAASGVVLDRIYESGRSVLLCAVFRGAMSACGALPALLLLPELSPAPILGPGECMGYITVIPLVLCAAVLFFLPEKKR